MTRRRVQLRRTKGWRKPPGAVVVARPTRWGNPYGVADHGRAQAVALYRQHLEQHPELVTAARRQLKVASSVRETIRVIGRPGPTLGSGC